eukprot:gene16967-biopygen7198
MQPARCPEPPGAALSSRDLCTPGASRTPFLAATEFGKPPSAETTARFRSRCCEGNIRIPERCPAKLLGEDHLSIPADGGDLPIPGGAELRDAGAAVVARRRRIDAARRRRAPCRIGTQHSAPPNATPAEHAGRPAATAAARRPGSDGGWNCAARQPDARLTPAAACPDAHAPTLRMRSTPR